MYVYMCACMHVLYVCVFHMCMMCAHKVRKISAYISVACVCVCVCVCACVCVCTCACARVYVQVSFIGLACVHTLAHRYVYRVATVSRIDKIIGLFCRILSLLLGSFAEETYNLIDPTNQSHPIPRTCMQILKHTWTQLIRSHRHVCTYATRTHTHNTHTHIH